MIRKGIQGDIFGNHRINYLPEFDQYIDIMFIFYMFCRKALFLFFKGLCEKMYIFFF